MRKLGASILLIFLSMATLTAQQQVGGTVQDASGQGIPGALVRVTGYPVSTLTDHQGGFQIFVPEGARQLVVSDPSGQEREIPLASSDLDQPLRVTLVGELDLFEMSLSELLDLEVSSVSKSEEGFSKAPQTLMVITEQDLRQRGYTDLEQVLHDLPGFDISRGNGVEYSNIYQRGYRSNNTDRTLLLIDGIEENDIWKGSAWISRQYPLSNIKRIEIIHGPASTMYGANAFVGAINIVTKEPEELLAPGQNAGADVRVGYGSYNTRYADATVAARLKDASFSLTARGYLSDEYDLSGFDGWKFDYVERRSPADYLELLGTDDMALALLARSLDSAGYASEDPRYSNTTNDWLVNAKFKLHGLTIGFQTWRRDEGTGAWYLDYRLGPEHDSRWVPANSFLYLRFQEAITEKLELTVFTRYKLHTLDGSSERAIFRGYSTGAYDLADLADPEGPAEPFWRRDFTFVHSNQLRNEIRLVYKPSDKLTAILGNETRLSHIQGDYLRGSEPDPSQTGTIGSEVGGGSHLNNRDLGFYAQASYRLTPWASLTLGTRVDDNRIRENGGFGTVVNSKAAAVLTPGRFIFKLMYSEAFKDADNWTKFSTTSARLLPSPDLQPEKVRNLELSAARTLGEHLFLDAAVFRAAYSGAVETATVSLPDGSTTTQHQALGSLEITGSQANVTFRRGDYSAYANHTFTHPWSVDGDKRIGDIANHQVNLGANALLASKLNLNLRANWVGRKPTGEQTTIGENPFDQIDPYFTLNGAISVFDFWGGLSAQLHFQNLLDADYFGFAEKPKPQRA